MTKWAADFALAVEINQPVINLVLDRFLQAFQAQLKYNKKLGKIGRIEAEIKKLYILDLEDIPQPGGVKTDLELEGQFKFVLFGLKLANTNLLFRIDDVGINFSKTPAGLPKGLVIEITPSLSVSLTFPKAKFISGWLLNKIVGPLISLGIWLAFRIIRRLEVPVWELVDIFGALGLRFTAGSPVLAAQKAVPPTSLLLASDFNLTNPLVGKPNQLAHFLPQKTSLGAVVHERVISAAVEMAFAKGWVPSKFRVKKWKIYINTIGVEFKQDEIRAFGSLKAKRGKCWCKVKVRITFSVSVKPRITDTNTSNPKISFTYNADINAHISTSGMLVVLGAIMFAPVFMALTVSASFLINIVLNQFLPFSTSFSTSGANMTITAKSVHFSGFIPLSMNFPLQLSGRGDYSLSRFTSFNLPGGGPAMNVAYTPESLSLQEEELRLAIDLV